MADWLPGSFCDNVTLCITGMNYIAGLDWEREFMIDDGYIGSIDAPDFSPAGSCKRYQDFMGLCLEQSVLKRMRLVP